VAPESAQKSRSLSVSTICIRETNLTATQPDSNGPTDVAQGDRAGTLPDRARTGIEPSARDPAGCGAKSGRDRTDHIDDGGRGNESVPSLPLADHDRNLELAGEDCRKGVMPFGHSFGKF
jgi:hypothetical protein